MEHLIALGIILVLSIVVAGHMYWAYCRITGLGHPGLAYIPIMREKLKQWRGIKPVSEEIIVVNGYMYEKVTYSDGKHLLFRD